MQYLRAGEFFVNSNESCGFFRSHWRTEIQVRFGRAVRRQLFGIVHDDTTGEIFYIFSKHLHTVLHFIAILFGFELYTQCSIPKSLPMFYDRCQKDLNCDATSIILIVCLCVCRPFSESARLVAVTMATGISTDGNPEVVGAVVGSSDAGHYESNAVVSYCRSRQHCEYTELCSLFFCCLEF